MYLIVESTAEINDHFEKGTKLDKKKKKILKLKRTKMKTILKLKRVKSVI